MPPRKREMFLGIALTVCFAGLLLWFALNEPQYLLKIFVGGLAILIGIISSLWKIMSMRRDREAGMPAEDEFTRYANVNAGNRAFHSSMYLWLLIFIFNSSFIKHEAMLGLGVLGSALLYGVWLLYFRTTGAADAK
ncbi:MAG: hypothetical protein E4G99_01305 [Anaerolineales bacterium]|nr:MAG: hypothetical protein E4G99_01305 [Anaerolineales bacterium]